MVPPFLLLTCARGTECTVGRIRPVPVATLAVVPAGHVDTLRVLVTLVQPQMTLIDVRLAAGASEPSPTGAVVRRHTAAAIFTGLTTDRCGRARTTRVSAGQGSGSRSAQVNTGQHRSVHRSGRSDRDSHCHS